MTDKGEGGAPIFRVFFFFFLLSVKRWALGFLILLFCLFLLLGVGRWAS